MEQSSDVAVQVMKVASQVQTKYITINSYETVASNERFNDVASSIETMAESDLITLSNELLLMQN